jgi:nucleoside-diphosphate-sugar epimerase
VGVMATVVVTGVTSFVGLHLAQDHVRRRHRVVAVTSRPRTAYDGIRARRLKDLEGKVEFVQADLTEPAAVARLVERTQPTLWLHHAGFADAYGSLDYDIAAGFAVNVVPLTHLYQSLAGGGCGVIVTGSSAEYSSSDGANGEDDLCWPDTPYGIAKLAETLRARQLAERHGVPTRVARLYIPFGPLDNPEKLLAQVMSGLRTGQPIDLSPCSQRRDFLGISDLCAGYRALEKDLPRGLFDVFNICSGQAIELREFLLNIAARMKADPALLGFGKRTMRPGEAAVSYGSNAKAARLLRWRPTELAAAIDRDLLAQPELSATGVVR